MSNVWTDVRIDRLAADDLIAELLASANAVGEVVGILAADCPLISEDWHGPHRDAFDDERARLASRAEALAANLQLAAHAVAAGVAEAEGEQALRERLRDAARGADACRGEDC